MINHTYHKNRDTVCPSFTPISDSFKKFKRKKKHRYRTGLKPVTICIAAISGVQSPYPKIVFCADRLISAGIQFEHGVPKMKDLGIGKVVMVASNDSLKSDMIIENVKKKIHGKKVSIKQVVHEFSNECKKLLLREMEKDILFKYGLSYANFIEDSQKISQDLIRIITNELENYNHKFKSDFLILGFDQDYTPHIYSVDEEGEYKLHDFLGFGTIGSGGLLAFSEMTKYSYHPNIDLSESLVRVYNCKKIAERVGGVGKITDMNVLHIAELEEGKKIVAIWPVGKEVKDLLDKGIENMKKKEVECYLDIMKQLDKFFEEAKEGKLEQPVVMGDLESKKIEKEKQE